MTTFLKQKQSNILADILTHHIQTTAVTHNIATEEDLQKAHVGSVTGDNPASPWDYSNTLYSNNTCTLLQLSSPPGFT